MVLNKIQTIKEIEELSSNAFCNESNIIKNELIRLEEDLKYIKNYFEFNHYVSTDKENTKLFISDEQTDMEDFTYISSREVENYDY